MQFWALDYMKNGEKLKKFHGEVVKMRKGLESRRLEVVETPLLEPVRDKLCSCLFGIPKEY